MGKVLKEKDADYEKKEAHHIAQAGVLTENIKTLREDLNSEQKRRETLEQKLDEVCGAKLGKNLYFNNIVLKIIVKSNFFRLSNIYQH